MRPQPHECSLSKNIAARRLRRAAQDGELGNQAGLSQAALAEAVGIPQRTISFHKREAGALPSTLAPALAKVLGVSMEELLGINDGAQRSKRGPKSQLERQLEAVATLPRQQQQKILDVVEAMIAHQR